MKSRTFATPLLFLSVCFPFGDAAATPYTSGWYKELQLSIAHESNVSHSWRSADALSDQAVSLSLGGGYAPTPHRNSRLVFRGYLTWTRHNEFNATDSLAPSIGVSWTAQPSAGFSNVWYNMTTDLTRFIYRDNDVREGTLFAVEAGANKRITSRSIGHLGVRHDRYLPDDAIEGAAWDTLNDEIYLGVDIELTRKIWLFGEYAYRRGDFTYRMAGVPGMGARYRGKSRDTAFDRCPGCIPWYAYRQHADSHKLQAGLVFAFDKVSLDLSGRYYDARSEHRQKYDNWMLQLGLVKRF